MDDSIETFDAEKAKAACLDILRALEEGDVRERLIRARESAGSDMVRVMREVFPIVTQVQLEVIRRYGFSSDADGAAQFLQLLRSLEKEEGDSNGELIRLSDQIRSNFLPPMTAPIHSLVNPTTAPSNDSGRQH